MKIFTIKSLLVIPFCLFFLGGILAQPANDLCAGAIVLSVGANGSCVNTLGDNTSATPSGETPAPTCSSFGTGEDVWFSVTVPASGSVTVETSDGGGFADSGMSIYSGTCGSLTQVDCDDDGGVGNFSLIELTGQTPGAVLLVRVFEYGNNEEGAFNICAYEPAGPPANDLCADAIVLPVGANGSCANTLGDNTSATPSGETPAPTCSSFGVGEDVWFSVTVPASGSVTVETSDGGGFTDSGMSIYSGACGSLTEVDCDDDGGTGTFSLIELTGQTPGAVLLVRVFEYGSNQEGAFNICAYEPPTTTCTISIGTGAQTACDPSTGLYTQEIIAEYADAPTTGTIDVNGQSFAVTSSPQTVLLTGLTADGAAVDVTASFSDDALCTATELGLFTAPVNCIPGPANDLCADAISLACGTIDLAGTTTSGTDNDPLACGGAGDGNNPGVWYTFTGDGGDYTISVNADPGNADDLGDSQLAIYTGGCAGLVCEAGNDDNTPPGGAGSQVTISPTVNGAVYYAYVDGFGTNSGDFLISLTCTAPPACPNPAALTTTNITGTSVDLGWTENGTSTIWDVEYGTPGFTQGTGTTVTGATTNPLGVTGLTNCTDYEFYVRADCGGGVSDWSGPFAFSTAGTAPLNLTPICGETVSYPLCPGTYNTNEDVTWTLCPDPGTYAVVEFTYIDLETRTTDDLCWDQLNVTGVNTEVVCGEQDGPGDGGVGSGFAGGDCLFHPVVDGCITVQFTSDGSGQESGFSFVFNCVADPNTLSCARSANPLPVEFVAFTGYAANEVNVLEWTTASEQGNSHFNIERSLDGINFEKIGTVDGAGNSSEVLNYSFEDTKPAVLTYYRVMQVDFDGDYTYSEVVKIKRESRGLSFGTISPNPTKGMTSIVLNTMNAGSFRLQVISVDGKIMSNQTIELTEGLNTQEIDMSSFSNGVYMLSVSGGDDRIITRIVKAE